MTTLESLAIIFATLMGPIFAILITFWRENRKARMASRYHIFRTLMSTRRIVVSREHVDALNLIEVEFYGHQKVQDAFRAYLAHLNTDEKGVADWNEIRLNKLATLLHRVSQSVRMPIGEIDIRTGGYAPQRWDNQVIMEQYLLKLARGEAAVPISLSNQPERAADEP